MTAVLAENLAERLVIKTHSSTTYDAVTEPVPATDPAATGGQILRFVSHNLSLPRDSYSPNEMRPDQQQPIDKLGTKRVPVTLNCLLSPATYKLPLAAVLKGAWSAAVVTVSETELTSIAADSTTSKFSFGGGDPVSEGFKVGDLCRPAALSETANNGINFMITAFGGTSNRDVTVFPAPTTMSADTAFTFATVGRSIFAPAATLVRSKYALEVYNSDSDIAKLFTEIRFGGFDFSIAPNVDAKINFSGMGRNRYIYSAGDAPFFTSPTTETTTDVISSMDGLLRMNGAVVGVATGLSISFAQQLQAPAQINRDGLSAGVVAQGNVVTSGEFTLFETDTAFHTAYDAHTEFEILAYLPASNAAAAAAMSIYLPRIKITNITDVIVDGAKALQCKYSAARYFGSGAGIESTSIRICDTEVS